MARADLTLHIGGEVGIDDFVRRLRHFDTMILRMVRELKAPKSEWVISDLDAGSATATVSTEWDSSDLVDQIEAGYLGVARALSRDDPSLSSFSNSVMKEARRWPPATERPHEEEFTARNETVSLIPPEELEKLAHRIIAFGEIRGLVETASIHASEYFAVYEAGRG